MKCLPIAVLLLVFVAACNNSTDSPPENASTGDSIITQPVDSISSGAGIDNSGGTPGGVTDTNLKKIDTPANYKRNRALRK